MEWEIEIPDRRIIGCVDDKLWDEYLKEPSPSNEFHGFKPYPDAQVPEIDRHSFLVCFPLLPGECIARRVYEVLNLHHAKLIDEESFV